MRLRTKRARSGLTDNWRKYRAISVLLLVMGGLVYFVAPASAVHDTGAFELDGDATHSTTDDWDNVCHEVTITNDTGSLIPDQCASASDTNNATSVSWTDDGGLNASIFTGGGSKDPIDIPSWAWKDNAGGLPDKDNLLHSFAARYSLTPDPATCPSDVPNGPPASTCEVLYFGSDRYDNSGDAQQGFWFFQNKVTLGTAKTGGGTSFNGVHKDGDVLVISDFSNGGTTSTITVYAWDHTVTGNLRVLETSTNAKCDASLASTDPFCGIVNPSTKSSPWSFTDKSGSHSFLNGEFYEGGVNLTSLGLGNECFSSVMSESRSSTSTTATLKDFVLGQLGECGSAVATTPKDGSGGAIPSGGLVLGSNGTVSVKDSANLTVHGISTWSGSLSFSLCKIDTTDPSAQQTCATGGTAVPADKAVDNTTVMPVLSDAATISSLGHYCWRAEFTPSQASLDAGLTGSKDSSSNECFDVIAVPTSITTRQFVFPNDSSKITLPVAGTLSGTAKFRLYDSSANCTATTPSDTVGTGGLLYKQEVAVSGAAPQTVKTTNTTVKIDSSTTVYWLVDYTSSDLSQLDSHSTCTENTAVTFTGNDSGITVP